MVYGYVIKAYEYTPYGIRQAERDVVWHPDKYIANQMAKQVADKWWYFDKVVIQPRTVVNVEWVGKID